MRRLVFAAFLAAGGYGAHVLGGPDVVAQLALATIVGLVGRFAVAEVLNWR